MQLLTKKYGLMTNRRRIARDAAEGLRSRERTEHEVQCPDERPTTIQ
jgi:hypothetical protein